MILTAKHSNVFYVYKGETGFEAVEKATGCKNGFGLDLFRYKGNVYEGRSGLRFITEAELFNLDFKIKSVGGIEKVNERIEQQIAKTGESPRYTRPDERKKDIFPPDPEKENTVFAKDGYGKKHYYHRFYNENGIELFTLQNAKEFNRTVFVQCEGYMLSIDQYHRFEEVLKWLGGLENGVKGEVERLFNESMANPSRWADPCFANILGRTDEAKAHNQPIREAREREYQQRDAEREAQRIAGEQAAKAEYEQALKSAESKILSRDKVINDDVQGKSLIMQLFREHEIAVPLKTQGWIINSLCDIYYNENRESWSYHYTGNNSTVFRNYLSRLVSAVQTKQQFEEMNPGDNGPYYDSRIENETERDDGFDEEYGDEI